MACKSLLASICLVIVADARFNPVSPLSDDGGTKTSSGIGITACDALHISISCPYLRSGPDPGNLGLNLRWHGLSDQIILNIGDFFLHFQVKYPKPVNVLCPIR